MTGENGLTLDELGARAAEGRLDIPATTAWYLADLGEALGRQNLRLARHRADHSRSASGAIRSGDEDTIARSPGRPVERLAAAECQQKGHRPILREMHLDIGRAGTERRGENSR